jgi:hypothetical protein
MKIRIMGLSSIPDFFEKTAVLRGSIFLIWAEPGGYMQRMISIRMITCMFF